MQELVLLHAREEPEVRTTGVGRGRKGRVGDNLPYVPEEGLLVPGQLRALQCVRVRTKRTHVASVGVLRTCACMRAPMCARAHLQALIPVSSPLDNQPGDSPSLLGRCVQA